MTSLSFAQLFVTLNEKIYKNVLKRVWKYQTGNQNPYYIEKEQTTQLLKEKVQKDKQRSTKHTYKTKERVTRTPLKTQVLRKGSSSCSTRGTHRDTFDERVIQQTISNSTDCVQLPPDMLLYSCEANFMDIPIVHLKLWKESSTLMVNYSNQNQLKRITTSHLKSLNTKAQHMALEIQVLVWHRHKCVCVFHGLRR